MEYYQTIKNNKFIPQSLILEVDKNIFFSVLKKKMQAIRPCGSRVRTPGRYSRIELVAMLQARGIVVKASDTIDTMCQTLGLIPGLAPVQKMMTADETLRQTILPRVADAQAKGKVLDVSHMLNNGQGIRLITRPAGRTKKLGPAWLPIVSNNRNAFVEVTRVLGPEYHQAIAAYDAVVAQHNIVIAPVAPLAPVFLPTGGYVAPVAVAARSPRALRSPLAAPAIPTVPLPQFAAYTRVVSPHHSPVRTPRYSPIAPPAPVKRVTPPLYSPPQSPRALFPAPLPTIDPLHTVRRPTLAPLPVVVPLRRPASPRIPSPRYQ